MRRVASLALVAAMLAVGATTAVPAPRAAAQAAPDRSEVVIVLDFSASILDDAANRNRFAAALGDIADRVDATAADLVAGDTRVSIVQFATSARDYPRCADLRLLDSPAAVSDFSNCLRSVAAAYRGGLNSGRAAQIGIDTNYVAAMEQAARHIPDDAVRPALILFTDGRHDVAGVPVSEVLPARDRLFGDLPTFALLPVGMGLDPAARDQLEQGLADLRVVREMPACVSGAVFDWPQVVFATPAEAGNAVAVGLQEVSCTFTVAPTPTPGPTPTPPPTPGPVRGISLTPGDGRVEVSWTAPAGGEPVVDYRVRCRAGEGDWIEASEEVSLATTAVVEGLENGVAHECQVAAVGALGDGAWTAASSTVTPVGRLAPPAKPAVEPLDRAVRVSVAPVEAADVAGFRFECSADGGQTWPYRIDAAGPAATSAEVAGLTNGVGHVCRAYVENPAGLSDPSEASDVVKPCGSLLECNELIAPLLAVLGAVLLVGLAAVLIAMYRGRTQEYVVAVVDVIHTANLGHGSRLGISFVRNGSEGPVVGITPDRSGKADIRIRHRGGGRFLVADAVRTHETESGRPIVAIDGNGSRHEVLLHAFDTPTAAVAAHRR